MKFDHDTTYYHKFPDEVFDVEFSFTSDLDTGETIAASSHASIWDSEENNKTASIISNVSASSTSVSFNIKNMKADETYETKIVGRTSSNNVYIHYLTIEVFEGESFNTKVADFTANSYVTIPEANEYIRNKYGHSSLWDTLDTEGKKRLLVEAAENMNVFNYIGEKYYDAQPLEFPRDDHEVITGYCATPITSKSFKHTSLKSSTYGKYPQNYWKYGSCHLVDDNEVGEIASSNVTSGIVHMKNDFSASLTTSTEFKVFAPIDRNVKHAQIEQALFLIEKKGSNTLYNYKDIGAQEVEIGDTRVRFANSMSGSKIPISSIAKKLLSRWIRKTLRLARA